MEQLTNSKLFLFLKDSIARDLDERTAFNEFRQKFGHEGLEGRSASERQDHFIAALGRYRTRPAALELGLRVSLIQEFREDLQTAFDSCVVGQHDIESFYGVYQRAITDNSTLPVALKLLESVGCSSVDELRGRVGELWPELTSNDSQT